MPHHRHLGVDHRAYLILDPNAAFEFHRLGTPFLNEATGVQDRVARADAKAQERQIRHEQRLRVRTTHRAGVVHHVIQRHLCRVRIAQNNHPQAVAHQDDIHIGIIHEPCRGVVIRGDGGDLLPALARPNDGGRDFLARLFLRAVSVNEIFYRSNRSWRGFLRSWSLPPG